tara:strand:- start:706 stop:996 length:291 start_codon:yes stop_codon:yes gene_type:complete
MKKLKTGDLVHVPAGAYRIKFRNEDDDGQMSIPWDCNMLMEPKIGIFKKVFSEREYVVVFSDGEWVIDNACVYLKNKGEKDVRINQHIEDRRTMVS